MKKIYKNNLIIAGTLGHLISGLAIGKDVWQGDGSHISVMGGIGIVMFVASAFIINMTLEYKK